MRKTLIFCLLPITLHATDKTALKSVEWSGEGELGFTATSGNSASESWNTSINLSRETLQWKHSASIDSIKVKSEDVTSTDSFVFKEKSEFKLSKKSFFFGQLKYEDDKFSGFESQSFFAFGVGSSLINNNQHLLKASTGIGYRNIKSSTTLETNRDTIHIAFISYQNKFSDSVTFNQSISIDSGSENTSTESDTELKTRINGSLATKINFQIKRNSAAPLGTEKIDRVTVFSFVFGF